MDLFKSKNSFNEKEFESAYGIESEEVEVKIQKEGTGETTHEFHHFKETSDFRRLYVDTYLEDKKKMEKVHKVLNEKQVKKQVEVIKNEISKRATVLALNSAMTPSEKQSYIIRVTEIYVNQLSNQMEASMTVEELQQRYADLIQVAEKLTKDPKKNVGYENLLLKALRNRMNALLPMANLEQEMLTKPKFEKKEKIIGSEGLEEKYFEEIGLVKKSSEDKQKEGKDWLGDKVTLIKSKVAIQLFNEYRKRSINEIDSWILENMTIKNSSPGESTFFFKLVGLNLEDKLRMYYYLENGNFPYVYSGKNKEEAWKAFDNSMQNYLPSLGNIKARLTRKRFLLSDVLEWGGMSTAYEKAAELRVARKNFEKEEKEEKEKKEEKKEEKKDNSIEDIKNKDILFTKDTSLDDDFKKAIKKEKLSGPEIEAFQEKIRVSLFDSGMMKSVSSLILKAGKEGAKTPIEYAKFDKIPPLEETLKGLLISKAAFQSVDALMNLYDIYKLCKSLDDRDITSVKISKISKIFSKVAGFGNTVYSTVKGIKDIANNDIMKSVTKALGDISDFASILGITTSSIALVANIVEHYAISSQQNANDKLMDQIEQMKSKQIQANGKMDKETEYLDVTTKIQKNTLENKKRSAYFDSASIATGGLLIYLPGVNFVGGAVSVALMGVNFIVNIKKRESAKNNAIDAFLGIDDDFQVKRYVDEGQQLKRNTVINGKAMGDNGVVLKLTDEERQLYRNHFAGTIGCDPKTMYQKVMVALADRIREYLEGAVNGMDLEAKEDEKKAFGSIPVLAGALGYDIAKMNKVPTNEEIIKRMKF